jgi:hypothetical protein
MLAVAVPAFILARLGKEAISYAVAFGALSLVHTGASLFAMTTLEATRFLTATVLVIPAAAALGMVGYLTRSHDGSVAGSVVRETRQAFAEAVPADVNVFDLAFFSGQELEPKQS